MSLEVENPPGIETTRQLKRQDSLYGDAEKVSSFKHHGSEVCFLGNLVTVLACCKYALSLTEKFYYNKPYDNTGRLVAVAASCISERWYHLWGCWDITTLCDIQHLP